VNWLTVAAAPRADMRIANLLNERNIGTMFTAPLTAAEYRILLEVKYCPGAAHIPGWALRETDGRIRGWHPYESDSRNWAHADDAFRSFVPDPRERRRLTLRGVQTVATTGIQDLTDLLDISLSDNIATAAAGHL
jgi:hypothetical protein